MGTIFSGKGWPLKIAVSASVVTKLLCSNTRMKEKYCNTITLDWTQGPFILSHADTSETHAAIVDREDMFQLDFANSTLWILKRAQERNSCKVNFAMNKMNNHFYAPYCLINAMTNDTIKLPSNHSWCSGVSCLVWDLGAVHLQSECTLSHGEFGIESSRHGHYSSAVTWEAYTNLSP